jgi:hypothetical protein
MPGEREQLAKWLEGIADALDAAGGVSDCTSNLYRAADLISTAELTQPDEADEAWARVTAEHIMQGIADSPPSELTDDAQQALAGTPMEGLYCLTGEEIIEAIRGGLSNAFYDGEIRTHHRSLWQKGE